MAELNTISIKAEYDVSIKGSMFKSIVVSTDSPKHIKKIINKYKIKYNKASHVCYAYRICDNYDLFDRSKFCRKHRDYFGLYKNSEIRKKVYSGDLKKLINQNLRKGIDELTKHLHKNFSIEGRNQSEKGGSQLTKKQFVAGASMLLKKMRIPH